MHGWPRVCRALQSAGRHDMQTALRSPPRQMAWKPFKRHKPITETALFKVWWQPVCAFLAVRLKGRSAFSGPRSTAT